MADALNSDTAIIAPSAALKTLESKGMSSNVRMPLGQINKLPGFNVRSENDEYKAAVRSLADSIKANGYYDHKPLGVFKMGDKDGVFIHDGHTRFDALTLLVSEGTEIADVPVALAPAGTTVEDLTVSLVQSNEGRPLAPIELAAVVKRLLSFKDDKNWVAERIGKTVRYIDNLLVLAGAPAAVRTAVANGKIAAAEAVKIVRKDPAKAAEAVKVLVKAAEDKGRTKATPAAARPATGPKMRAITIDVSAPEGDKMGDVLKGLAKRLRDELLIGSDDKLQETGTISIKLHVIDHAAVTAAAEKAAAAAAKPAPAPKVKAAPAAKPAVAPKADAAPAAEKPKRVRKPKVEGTPAVTTPVAETAEGGTTPEVVQDAVESLEAGIVPAAGTAEGDVA